ncbi:hypothetical protein EGR_11101 [Echinococcus granulosus]|uniref:Uncharacterized protein n=1 Tax=Echinococcus granulosus TaxID=6210 RepID=W6U0S1_ECHGR|nr:hypothetical protein EGR_11101 [Echinococcus granulosus]EUB54041.1 hypothetical protein EGR_11101 [Echinococcus granulosus]
MCCALHVISRQNQIANRQRVQNRPPPTHSAAAHSPPHGVTAGIRLGVISGACKMQQT